MIDYKDNIELKEILLEIADDLSTPIPVSQFSNNKDDYWKSKYIICHRNLSLKEQM